MAYIDLFEELSKIYSRTFLLRVGCLAEVVALAQDRLQSVRLRLCRALFTIRLAINDESEAFAEILQKFNQTTERLRQNGVTESELVNKQLSLIKQFDFDSVTVSDTLNEKDAQRQAREEALLVPQTAQISSSSS
jgi:hypothetical protein